MRNDEQWYIEKYYDHVKANNYIRSWETLEEATKVFWRTFLDKKLAATLQRLDY